MATKINFDKKALADICRRHCVRRLAFFGSVVRDDFGPNSDVDVLVEYSSEHIPSLLDLGQLNEELVQLFGRQVDIVTYGSLSNPYRRASILADEVVQYDEAG